MSVCTYVRTYIVAMCVIYLFDQVDFVKHCFARFDGSRQK